MNGCEFVEKIIGQTYRGVSPDIGPLIKLTDGVEVEWLEFKAATLPIDGVLAPNTCYVVRPQSPKTSFC